MELLGLTIEELQDLARAIPSRFPKDTRLSFHILPTTIVLRDETELLLIANYPRAGKMNLTLGEWNEIEEKDRSG